MPGVKAPISRQPWPSSTGAISAIAAAKTPCLPRTSWIFTCRYTALSSVTGGFRSACFDLGDRRTLCNSIPESNPPARKATEEAGHAVRGEGPDRYGRGVRARRCGRAPLHGRGGRGGGGRPRRGAGTGGGRQARRRDRAGGGRGRRGRG